MIISIFGGTVLRAGMEGAEARAMDRLMPVYQQMPGFISYRTYAGEDGDEISIARFTIPRRCSSLGSPTRSHRGAEDGG